MPFGFAAPIFFTVGKLYNQKMERVNADTVPQPADHLAPRRPSLTERTLPLRYPLFILGIVAVVTLGQVIEDALDTPSLEMLTPAISIPRWTLVLLTLYMLVMLRVIPRTASRCLREIRPTVNADEPTFSSLRARMTRLPLRLDLLLAVVSLLFVILLFPVLNSPLPITRNPLTNERTFLPGSLWNAAPVVVAYALVGWAALSLVVTTLRLGKALGELTQLPLRLDVFDNGNVLPLGRLALVQSLAPAGVVLLLLMGLGTPDRPLAWFAFLLVSLASVLALILPLRGVHRQMDAAKKDALAGVNHELSEIHRETLNANAPDATRTAFLSNRINTLVNLRKMIQEGPTWPFQSTVAVSRALLVASAPLIYAVLNELIRIFFIDPLAR